jgi:hypothetical protein
VEVTGEGAVGDAPQLEVARRVTENHLATGDEELSTRREGDRGDGRVVSGQGTDKPVIRDAPRLHRVVAPGGCQGLPVRSDGNRMYCEGAAAEPSDRGWTLGLRGRPATTGVVVTARATSAPQERRQRGSERPRVI